MKMAIIHHSRHGHIKTVAEPIPKGTSGEAAQAALSSTPETHGNNILFLRLNAESFGSLMAFV